MKRDNCEKAPNFNSCSLLSGWHPGQDHLIWSPCLHHTSQKLVWVPHYSHIRVLHLIFNLHLFQSSLDNFFLVSVYPSVYVLFFYLRADSLSFWHHPTSSAYTISSLCKKKKKKSYSPHLSLHFDKISIHVFKTQSIKTTSLISLFKLRDFICFFYGFNLSVLSEAI